MYFRVDGMGEFDGFNKYKLVIIKRIIKMFLVVLYFKNQNKFMQNKIRYCKKYII